MAEVHAHKAGQQESDIRKDWRELYDASTSGQKAWLSQMKNHYAAIIAERPEEAAELLAMHEHNLSLIREHGYLDRDQ